MMKKSTHIIFLTGIFILLLSATVMGQQLSLVSFNSSGTGGGNDPSLFPVISEDGHYIAFSSVATNLVPNDSNGKMDAFVRDTIAGTNTLISVNNAGDIGNNDSSVNGLSADGQFVLFSSTASNLVPNDNNNYSDIFLRNLTTGITTLVSINSNGTGSGNSLSFSPQMSADGRYVAFLSLATDIVPNDTNGNLPDVFVRDIQTGTTTLASASILGGSGNADTVNFAFSANGRYVALESYASDLVLRDGNDKKDIFVRDLVNGTTAVVSVNRLGTRSGNGTSYSPTISADGRFIAFVSSATNLTGNDTNGSIGDVFVRDIIARTTTLASVNRDGNAHGGWTWVGGPVISANGRVVLFSSWDSDMVEGDDNGRFDVFARDLNTGTTYFISANVPRHDSPMGEFNYFISPVVSGDGRYVVFGISRVDNLSGKNIYVRDLISGSVTLLNTNSGYSGISHPAINGDGHFIAFDSYADDLLPNVSGGNVYVFRNTPLAGDENADKLTR
jgi:hypothetical protein